MSNGSEFRARAGTMTLLFIASSVDRDVILRILANALEDGNLNEEEFAYEEEMAELGPPEVEDLDPDDMPDIEIEPGIVVGPHTQMQLTSAGRELLFVGSTLETWLSRCPNGPLRLGDLAAGSALIALVCGWSATIVHALAGEPRTLEELNQIIDIISYETLEAHVDAMHTTGLLECRLDGSEAYYAATPWLREGIAPLAAAARLELRSPMDDMAPIDALDASAGFMLAVPLVDLPPDLRGVCRLGMELEDGTTASAVAHVQPGSFIHGDLGMELQDADAWATASAEDWLDTVIEPTADRVQTSGDRALADALVSALHQALFAPKA